MTGPSNPHYKQADYTYVMRKLFSDLTVNVLSWKKQKNCTYI